jgi:RNA polymerase sigma-70 factor (ECF subfamily)
MRSVRAEGNLALMNTRKAKSSALETADEDRGMDAFERTFEQHWASIYRLLRSMVGDPAEAEDLALETMYRLYQQGPRLHAESNIGGWLHRVATNLGLHSIRSFRRRERYEETGGTDVLVEAPEDWPQEIAAGAEERRMARQALAEMDNRQSELLVMRYSAMSYKDIAAALHLSPTSIGPLLVRAEREFEKRYRRLAQEDL